MPTTNPTIDTYLHSVSQIEGGLSALDLWSRRIGLLDTTPLNARKVHAYDSDQTAAMAGEANTYDKQQLSDLQLHQCPLTLSATIGQKNETFQFDIDPVIAVTAANQIATRHVAKSGQIRGTIKESWAQDDWKIDIRAIIEAPSAEALGKKVAQLISIICADQAVKVVCPYLQECYAIDSLVVQSYQFPATKGLRYQQVSLSCLSDDDYDLLQDIK